MSNYDPYAQQPQGPGDAPFAQPAPYAQPVPYAQPTPYGMMSPAMNQTTNGMAIAALICGLLIPGIISIILGFVARNQIKRDGGKGNGMALAGIILGFISLAIIVIWIVIVFIAIMAAPDTYSTY